MNCSLSGVTDSFPSQRGKERWKVLKGVEKLAFQWIVITRDRNTEIIRRVGSHDDFVRVSGHGIGKVWGMLLLEGLFPDGNNVSVLEAFWQGKLIHQ